LHAAGLRRIRLCEIRPADLRLFWSLLLELLVILLTCVCVWSLLVVMSMVMLVTRLCGLVYADIIVESKSRNKYG